MAKYWILRLTAAIVAPIPAWISRPLAVALGTLLWVVRGNTRRRVECNLRRIPALREHPDRLSAAARGVFQSSALNYLDFFRGAHISDAELRAGWTIENQDEFDALMAEGRGLIILTAHFGNFEFGGSRLGVLGHKLIAPAEHMQPEAVFQLFCRLRQHHNLRLVPADSRDALRELLEALKRGEIVIFAADRYVIGAATQVPLFGELAKVPTGPFTLALRSGAPVMGVFSWRTSPSHYHGVFTRLPFEALRRDAAQARAGEGGAATATTATRVRSEEVVQRAQRVFLDEMERRIAQHPDQWVSALAPVWEEV